MKPADASPVAGPIIPARVVTRTRRPPDDPVAQRWPVWLLIAAMGAALFVCPALGFLSLAMHEATGLPWVLLGFLPGTLVGLAVPLVRRYRQSHPAPEPIPDEHILVVLDRLRLFGRAHGWEEGTDRDTEAWLTAHGCYLGSGRLVPWGGFLGYHVDSIDSLVHRVALRRRLSGRERLKATGGPLLLFGFLSLGPVVDSAAAVAVYHRYGLRTDVLAAAITALMLVISLGCLLITYYRQPGRAGSHEDALTVSVDGECASRWDLEDLLGQFLPRTR